MPVAFWWGRWMVCLPTSAKSWDEELLCAVLAHELGHVARRDAATDFVGQMAFALYWIHPLIWFATTSAWAARKHRVCV